VARLFGEAVDSQIWPYAASIEGFADSSVLLGSENIVVCCWDRKIQALRMKGAQWVEPKLTAKVRHLAGAKYLRHAVVKALG